MRFVSKYNQYSYSVFACLILLTAASLHAGSIFITGQDPDYHASPVAGSHQGPMNITRAAIRFVRDPMVNPFVGTATTGFLFVEGRMAVPEGHGAGKLGIVASGFMEGVDFEHHDATTLHAELDQLGTKYDSIVVASDFGGLLTQTELDILNARTLDIMAFGSQFLDRHEARGTGTDHRNLHVHSRSASTLTEPYLR